MRLIDISPTISSRIAVFPGDTPFSREVTASIDDSCAYETSSITSTTHLGAHTDAPSHYRAGAPGIGSRDPATYYGPCQVIEVAMPPGTRIMPVDIPDAITTTRVLFKTQSYPDPDQWNDDFVALSAQVVDFLERKGVTLVGIDTPSIDPAGDTELEAHQAVAKHSMAVLEGVVLHHVAAGRYTLVALPLKIEGADASPVRAVLVDESSFGTTLFPTDAAAETVTRARGPVRSAPSAELPPHPDLPPDFDTSEGPRDRLPKEISSAGTQQGDGNRMPTTRIAQGPLGGESTELELAGRIATPTDVRDYVLFNTEAITKALRNADSRLQNSQITWVSPRENDAFMLDGVKMLERIGVKGERSRAALDAFWPDAGPPWSALAQVHGPFGAGAVMVWSASSLADIATKGMAGVEGAEATLMVARAMSNTRRYLSVPTDTEPWATSYSAVAERLAWLWFLQTRLNLPTWMVFLGFSGDTAVPAEQRIDFGNWYSWLEEIFEDLGIPGGHALEDRIIITTLKAP